MSWSTSEWRVRMAPLNRFKPSSKIFYWPFQGGTSFVDLLGFALSCVCYVFVRVCLYVFCGHLLGKGWLLGSRLWCLNVSLSLSHWYPWSIVVLDCIDSCPSHPYLLCRNLVVVCISRCSLFRGYFIFIKTGCAGRTLNTPLIYMKSFSNNLLSDNKCWLPEF